MSETLYEKALRLLGRPVQKAVDADDADTRMDDSVTPTDKKLEAAGEEAAAGGQAAGGAEGGAEGGVPGDPGAGAEGGAPEPDGDEGAGGAGDGDGDEDEDLSDDDVREMRKAFGLTDFDDVNDTKKGKNIAGMLGQILAHIQKTDAYMQKLTSELAEMKASHKSGAADSELRVTMKAVDEKVDALQKVLDNLYRTAPAAAPKAVQKAMGVEPEQPRLTLTDVTNLALQGKISAAESARLTRQINHQTPARAGN